MHVREDEAAPLAAPHEIKALSEKAGVGARAESESLFGVLYNGTRVPAAWVRERCTLLTHVSDTYACYGPASVALVCGDRWDGPVRRAHQLLERLPTRARRHC
jgi:hypothetical protein